MTHDELKHIFGDSLQEVEVTIPENAYRIDINVSFDNCAVYYNAEFTKSSVVKAHICDFKRAKKHGVVPNYNTGIVITNGLQMLKLCCQS